MAFEFFITCDGEDCKSRRPVQQPGQMPTNWIHIQYVKPAIAMAGGDQLASLVSKFFCSGKCAHRFTRQFVDDKPGLVQH